MKQLTLACTIAVAMLATGIDLRAQSGYDLFQKALATERADGNLRGAIQLYERIVKEFARDRTLVARALVRMAECHEKLGNVEARRIYQTIVREFADQSDAVTAARARLTTEPAAGAVRGDRAVWTGPRVDMFGQVSPDGRYITYVNWGGDQNLYVRDLVAGTDRQLTTTGASVGLSQFAEFSAISRDGKQVAYAWYNDKRLYDIRIVPLHAPGIPDPRRVFTGSEDMRGLAPHDWSPDGRTLAVHVSRRDGSGQIGLLTVADGTLRVLKSIDWRGPTKIAFSPDGRFLAYDLRAGDNDAERTLYVIAVDGSRESPVVVHRSHNVVMGWSRDGQHLLFGSDRTGQMSLWSQPIAGGQAQGTPALVRRDIGSAFGLGLSDAGTLFVYKGRSGNYVETATLDLATPAVRVAANGAFQRFIGSGGRVSWSADGRHLAYTSCPPGPRAVCAIEIADSQTGEVRLLQPMLAYIGSLQWSADAQSLFTSGNDFHGRQSIFRVDARSGATSTVTPRPGAIERLRPEGDRVYFRRDGRLIERVLETGTERELFRQSAAGSSLSLKVSPDGRQFATVEGVGNRYTLYVGSVSSGTPREVLVSRAGEELDGYRLEWTPDSRAVLLPKTAGGDKPRQELWHVPVDGSAPRQVMVPNIASWVFAGGGFAIHPDGRRLAYVGATGGQDAEVWAIENVTPKAEVR
jgi:Tol biopolymer transport system component